MVDNIGDLSYFAEYNHAENCIMEMLPMIKELMFPDDLFLKVGMEWKWPQKIDEPLPNNPPTV